MPAPLPYDDPRAPTTPAARARLNGARGLQQPARQPQKQQLPPVKAPVPEPSPDEVTLGETEHGRRFGLQLGELMAGRLLVQGNSGAGKSWLLRKLLEASAGRVQHIVLDPEGEFATLAEHLDYPVAAADRLGPDGLSTLAERLRAERASLVLDLSDLEREQQMRAVAWFLGALVTAPREHWHPALVAVDEAHLFAPYGGAEPSALRKSAIAALVDLMSRGRKRGLAGVLATQRLARLSKSVAAEVSNFLIGVNTLDLDIRRAAETIGWDARRAFDRLPMLTPGRFVAVGPAFRHSPVVAAIGMVESRHLGGTPAIAAPPRHSAIAGAERLGLDALARAAETAAMLDERTLPAGARAVRQFLRDPAGALAARLFAELQPLYPEGGTLGSLAAECGVEIRAAAAAVALLGTWGAVDTSGDPGPGLAVRMSASMRP